MEGEMGLAASRAASDRACCAQDQEALRKRPRLLGHNIPTVYARGIPWLAIGTVPR